MDRNDIGYLPAISIGTLIVFYLIWAALHDIAHASEPDYTLEYIALGLSIPAFGILYRAALLHLGRRA